MKACGLALAIMMLLAPGLAVGQAEDPPPDSPFGGVAMAPPWLVAQAAPIFPPGPWPQPPRPPRGLGPGMGAWWTNSEIVKKLGLSETQVTRIERTFMQSLLRLVDLRADLEKQELHLRPLLDVDRPDEAKVAAQLDLITAARGKLEKGNAMMMLAIRRVLSIEQWKSLQQERGRPGAPPPPYDPGPQPPHQFAPGPGR